MTKARDLANAGTALTSVSATELGYMDGVTSAIQTQLNNKQAVVSGVDDTEIGYLNGVTSAIQTQLDGKIAKSLVDAKGDIIAATAADTVTRLAVGTDGQVLTSASTTATGLAWTTLSSFPPSAVASVSNNETRTSSAYGDLTTSGPEVTLTTGTKALVIIGAEMRTSGAGAAARMSVNISGSSSISPSDSKSAMSDVVGSYVRATYASVYTGLTAGSNTFTAKYRVGVGGEEARFINREILVINLGS